MGNYKEIPVNRIVRNPQQPRKNFSQKKLLELAASIEEHGVIQPIEVEQMEGDWYMLHHGERRWRAATMAGLETIPAMVTDPLDEQTRLERALIENIQREDMDPIETARAYQQLVERGMNMSQIARRTGKALATIKNHLEWLNVEEPIQALVAAGELPRDPRVREAILSVPADVRLRFAQKCRTLNITGVQKAADVLNKSLESRKQSNGTAPKKRDCPEKKKRRLGDVRAHSLTLVLDDCPVPGPLGDVVEAAAQTTCEACGMFDFKPAQVCRDCPATKMVSAIVEAAEKAQEVV